MVDSLMSVPSKTPPRRKGNRTVAGGSLASEGGTREPAAAADVPRTVRDLLSFRFHALGNIWSETSQLYYPRRFGLKLSEWKIISTVGGSGSISLSMLGRRAGMDNAAASRMVTALIAAGLLSKTTDPVDRRAVQVTLSAKGRETYLAIFDEAVRRNTAWLSVLNPEEREMLDELLNRLTRRARELARQEREEGGHWEL